MNNKPQSLDLGPYELVSTISEKNYSASYIATKKGTQQSNFLKVFYTQEGPEELAQDLAKLQSKLQLLETHPHEHIIAYKECWHSEGRYYFPTEFFHGISLADFLIDNPLTIYKSLKIIIQIGEALNHLHRLGLWHGAIEPSNILIDSSEEIKIINIQSSWLKKKYHLNGVEFENHSPPEIATAPTALSDIYSLGILAYEMLSNTTLKDRVFITLIPEKFQKIILQAIQEDPIDRYQSTSEFIQDLKKNYTPEVEQKRHLKQQQLIQQLLGYQEKFYKPKKMPSWPGVSLSIDSYQGVDISGVYYGFYQQDASFNLFLAEPSHLGVEGIMNISNLRGCIEALLNEKLDPKFMIKKLNAITSQDILDEAYSFAHLQFQPQKNELTVISCGYPVVWIYRPSESGSLEQILAKNVSLGIQEDFEVQATSTSWNKGDLVFLSTFSIASRVPQDQMQRLLQQSKQQPSIILKNMVEMFKQQQHHHILDRTALFIVLKRED